MAYSKRTIKDRIVEFAHRYKMTLVDGTTDTYDLEPVTGVVTEAGTTINKTFLEPIEDTFADHDSRISGIENGNTVVPNADTATTLDGLTPTIAELNHVDGVTSPIQTQLNGKAPTNHASTGTSYGIGNPTTYGHVAVKNDLNGSVNYNGEALSYHQGYLLNQQNNASYLAFCGNVNTDILDSAFGKNNEDLITGIGRQLAMYSWFKGDSKTTFPFTVSKTKNTLSEILADTTATEEIAKNSYVVELLEASSYAKGVVKNKIPMPVSEGSVVIASNIKSIGSSYATVPNVPYTFATITAPYSGIYLLDMRYVWIGSDDTYNITVKINNVSVFSQNYTPNYYSYQTKINISVAKNDVIDCIITNKYTSNKTLFGGHGAFLISDRPLTCTSASSIGNTPIWNIPNVDYSKSANLTEAFTAPYAGTFRLLCAGKSYTVGSSTYFAVYKNGVLYATPTTDQGEYFDIPMNAGDTIQGYTNGNSSVNNGHSYFTIFTICKTTNQNTESLLGFTNV